MPYMEEQFLVATGVRLKGLTESYIMGDPIPSIALLIGAILLSVVVTKAEQQGVKMKITVSTNRNNKTMETWYLDLNRHLTGTEHIILKRSLAVVYAGKAWTQVLTGY